jgi:uncharacterized protein with NRDE domain
MCLILFALQQHPDYPLVVIANRDEYYARATHDAHWWESGNVFGGRDLEAGGTWLGVNRQGKFAAVTNVRESGAKGSGLKSRGELTQNFLATSGEPEAYLRELSVNDQDYAGFNLLLGSPQKLFFHSNRQTQGHEIEPGIYGISNGSFNESWPKLSSGRTALAALLKSKLDANKLMGILTDNTIAEDHELPDTGVTTDIERLLSSRFIQSPEYGTRACTVVLFDNHNRISVSEQNFTHAGRCGDLVQESFITEVH